MLCAFAGSARGMRTNPNWKERYESHGSDWPQLGNQISGNEHRRSVRKQAPVQNQHGETGRPSRWAGIEGDHHRYFCSDLNSGSLNPSWLQFVKMNGRCNSRLWDRCG